MKKALVLLGVTLLLIVVSQLLRPVIFKAGYRDITGVVISVYGNDKQQLFLRLSNCDRKFQLSAESAKKLSHQDFKTALLGKRVSIVFHDNKLALNRNAESEISKITINKQILYSEVSE
jgi:hypothetical protein